MTEKIDIPAIHDDDLKSFLTKLGFADQIEKGELFCPYSNTQITWDNIGAIMLKNGAVTIVCDSKECLEFINQNKNG